MRTITSLFCAVLFACAIPVSAQTFNAADAPKIDVEGVGTVSAFPNAANITLGLRFTKPTLKEAIAENEKATRQVLAVVRKYVTDTTGIKVSLISTDKQMRWSAQQKKDIFVGFESAQKIIFTLNDLNRLQDFTEEVMKTRIYEIERVSYFHTQGAEFIKQAQEIAVADALETTKRLAKAAGLKMGKIIKISTDSSPATADNTTEDSYRIQSYRKEIEVRTVASSGQLLNYTVRVSLETLIE
jgi:uncharacterized protein YggE